MAVGDLIKSLAAEAKAKGMSEEAVYLEDLLKAQQVPQHNEGGHTAVPVCGVYYQKKLTPASPVVFDTFGKDKNALIVAKGVFEIDVYTSIALEAFDGNGVGLGVPESPEGWSFIGEIIGVEPRPYQLFDMMPHASMKLSKSRWVKFDMKRGISPDISIFAVGA